MRAPPLDDSGFTLIEVLMAMLILATGAMGMAELLAVAAVSTRSARIETSTTVLAVDKIEQLRGLTWGYDSAGAPVSDTTTDVSTQPASNGGPGLRASPVDSLERNTAGYVDFLDGSGRWVGAGPSPPGSATYVRRWFVEPLSTNPSHVLVLQVLVTTVVRDASRRGGSPRSRSPEDTVLVALKTRTARVP